MKALAPYKKLLIHLLLIAGALLSAGLFPAHIAVIVTAVLGIATSFGLYSSTNAPANPAGKTDKAPV